MDMRIIMSQASNTTSELELLYEFLPDSFFDEIEDLETKVKNSELTEREYLTYVLATVSDKTGKESAKLMEIEEGTYWGKLGRVRKKIDASETTIELRDLANQES